MMKIVLVALECCCCIFIFYTKSNTIITIVLWFQNAQKLQFFKSVINAFHGAFTSCLILQYLDGII